MSARSDLQTQLSGDTWLSVYVLVGEEPLLMSEALAQLRERTLSGCAARDFNRDEFQASDVEMDSVIRAARTLPMMAARRFVCVTQIHKLSAAELNKLELYVEAPSPTTVLVLAGDKLDLRSKMGARLNKSNVVFDVRAPRGREFTAWFARRCKHRNVAIDTEALATLIELVGQEVGPLDRACDSLQSYADAAPIDTDAVAALIAHSRSHSVFELTEALAARNTAGARIALEHLLEGGENALPILGLISRLLRQMIYAKELPPGTPSGEAARRLGVPPFVIANLLTQSRKFTTDGLTRALRGAHLADERLKSMPLPAAVVLEALLAKIDVDARAQ